MFLVDIAQQETMVTNKDGEMICLLLLFTLGTDQPFGEVDTVIAQSTGQMQCKGQYDGRRKRLVGGIYMKAVSYIHFAHKVKSSIFWRTQGVLPYPA